MSKIIDWLNGNRDFITGIEILQTLDPEQAKKLDNVHAKPEQLFYALRKYLDKPIVQKKESILLPSIAKHQNIIHKKSEQNEVAQEAKRFADKLYKEMSNKRALLFNLCPAKKNYFENEALKVAERAQLTQEVIALDYQVTEAYAAVQFAIENGRKPEKFVIEDIPDNDLYRKISNAQKYISYLTKLPNPTIKQLQRLKEKEIELRQLKERYDKF